MLGRIIDAVRAWKRGRIWSADQATGRRGEDAAHRFLRAQGFVIVARNYRLSDGRGEADLIARDGDVMVIVEVKTRTSEECGPPERAVGAEKHQALRRVARDYARRSNVPLDRVRCDIVTVVLDKKARREHLGVEHFVVEHFKDALRLS